nr:MAG TPA: collagen adhesion protein [Caudoviricetes sp.]
MKRVIASLGLGAVIVGGMINPAIAEDSQRIHAEITKTTSASRQTTSEVSVAGTWSVEKLAVGQFFTVSAEPNPANGEIPFAWAASFPFTLDDGTRIGECDATQMTITCKVTEVPAAYADKTDVKGTWWAKARIQDGAVGTTEGTIVLNGKADKKIVWGDAEGTGVCSNDCDSPVHFEYARPENLKFGWNNSDGTVGWGIKWIANGGTEYTVKDFDSRLNTSVKCATSDTWDPATTKYVTADQIDDNTIKFVAPEGSKVCITYPPEATVVPEGQNSVTNHAEVNGMKLEATTTIKSSGGTNGDGSVKPEPKPSETTPAPKPSETTPAPKPSEKPTPVPSTSTPTPKPSVTTPAPKPSVTTPAPKQNVTPATPKTSEQPKLAKTGASAAIAGALALLLALLGVGLLSISRKDTH